MRSVAFRKRLKNTGSREEVRSVSSLNTGKRTCRQYGCICATCLMRNTGRYYCTTNCNDCNPDLPANRREDKCEEYTRKPDNYPCRCLHKDHYCIECIFSKIKGRYDITKAQGMCKLGDWFHKNWITTDEANEMIMSLPKEEREKYIFAE